MAGAGRSFTYWQTFDLMPGVTAEIVRKTTITGDEAFYDRIVDAVKYRTKFSWTETQTIIVSHREEDSVPHEAAPA